MQPHPGSSGHATEEPALANSAGPLASAVTFRACTLGFTLTLMYALVTPYNDNIAHGNYFVGNDMPLTLIFTLLVLNVVVNPLLGKRRFRASEMAVATGMALISCAFPSSGFYRVFTSLLADSMYFAREYPWFRHYLSVIPADLMPSKRPGSPVLRNYFLGFSPSDPRGMGWAFYHWAHVFVAWSFFFLPMFTAVILFCVLMRRQWVDKERLAFPLVIIPLRMMEDPDPGRRLNSLWRSKALWIGALIPVIIHLNNGMALFYKSRPVVPLKYNLTNAFTQYPWNQLSYAIQTGQIYFTFIGATYFVPLDISFSLWFFFLAYNLGTIFFTNNTAITNADELYQGMGMVWAYGIILLYVAREHLWQVLKSVGKPRSPDEFLSPGANVLGLLACILMAAGFLAYSYGNLFNPANLLLGVLVVLIVLFYGMVATRLVIEGGLLLCQLPAGLMPFQSLTMLFNNNPQALSLRQWMVSLFSSHLCVTDYRETLMPFAADALRMGSAAPRNEKRRYLLMLLIAMLACLVASGALNLALSYHFGHQNFDDGFGPYWFPQGAVELAQQFYHPSVPLSQGHAWGYLGVGAAAILLLFVARWIFPEFPLHPLGLLVLNSWGIGMIWYSVMISWALKWCIMRWGGSRGYARARPFFIGLIVGDAISAAFWIVFGWFHHWPSTAQAYLILPH